MRERTKIEAGAYAYNDRDATRDNVLSALLETSLDCRDLLVEITKSKKRGIKIVELELTDREKEVLNGLEEH